jgi:hypothetical protein
MEPDTSRRGLAASRGRIRNAAELLPGRQSGSRVLAISASATAGSVSSTDLTLVEQSQPVAQSRPFSYRAAVTGILARCFGSA